MIRFIPTGQVGYIPAMLTFAHRYCSRLGTRSPLLPAALIGATLCTFRPAAAQTQPMSPSFAASPIAPPAAIPGAPPAPAPAAAVVDFQPDAAAHLQRRVPQGFGAFGWETICMAPCRVRLDTSNAYRIAGPGVVESDPFLLDPNSQVVLHAEVGSRTQLVIGFVLAYGGASMALIGISLVGAGSLIDSVGTTSGSTSRSDVRSVGWVTAGVGVAAGIGGLAMALPNLNTNVSLTTAPTGGKPTARLSSWLYLQPDGLHF